MRLLSVGVIVSAVVSGVLGLTGCGEGSSSSSTTVVPTASTAAAAPIKLLAVGDSITAGPYYRAPLQVLLEGADCRVDFVGSAVDAQPDQDGLTDLENEGHGGWTADQIADNARAWAAAAEPDVVLLYAGVNDFYEGDDVGTVTGDLIRTVAELRAGAPEAKLLVARIMPAVGLEAQVADYDLAIGQLGTDNVTVVDIETGFDHTKDTVDGVHPNGSASERMAEAWFDALEPLLTDVCGQ